MKKQFNNFGTISEQHLVEEFEWNEKQFYSYVIGFKEYDGFFRIIREAQHEQALIGAKMLFNYSLDQDKINGYRIVGYEENKKIIRSRRVKKLLQQRKQRETGEL